MSFSFGQKKTRTSQNQQVNPWEPAIPQLKGFLGELGGLETGPSATQTGAIESLQGRAAQGDPFAGQQAQFASDLFATPDRTGGVQDAFKTFQGQTGGVAAGQHLDPFSNPYLQEALQQNATNVQDRINAQFAGAGRDLSGANQQAVARGVSEATLPLLFEQFNRNQAQQLGAAGNLFQAGVGSSQAQAGLEAQRAGLRGGAFGASRQAIEARDAGDRALLDLEAERKGIPVQDLGALASLLLPTAGLGQQATGQGTSKQSGFNFGASIGDVATLLSDRRAKEDIHRVGSLVDGLPVYSYRYKGDPVTHIGVMAQDVEKRDPDAVIEREDGLKTVNLDIATRRARDIVNEREVA